MVEPLLSGIVLGLVPITIAGLLVTAYLQYRRGDSLNFLKSNSLCVCTRYKRKIIVTFFVFNMSFLRY
jgi:cytochrome b6-f complex subunit 5